MNYLHYLHQLPLLATGYGQLLDVLIIVVIFAGTLAGFRLGFIVGLAGILGIALAFVVAKVAYGPVHTLLGTVLPHGRGLTAVSYLLIFVVVWWGVMSAARGGRFIVRLFLLGLLDRLAGAILGLIESIAVVELLLYVGKRLHVSTIQKMYVHSQLAPKFLHLLPFIDKFFPHIT
jgi:membrane protein required for colicin V production